MAPPQDPEFVLQENPAAVRWLDSLQTTATNKLSNYRYNPNFLSDYQGYMLGMSPAEIDRIFAYRTAGNWIESEAEFWAVSKIAVSKRKEIASRLRFKRNNKFSSAPAKRDLPDGKPVLKNINEVSATELAKIRGIGPVLSERIVKFRKRLGGFLVNEQLYDVYGLDREVADRILRHYVVKQEPKISVININQASAEEIASLVYLSRQVAFRIVRHREQHGPFEKLEELTKIEDFPSDKIDRISLYLSL